MNRFLEEVFHEEPGACAQARDQHQRFVEVGIHSGCPATSKSSANCGSDQERDDKWPVNEAAKNINDV